MSAKQRPVVEWAETVLSKCTTTRAVPPLTEVLVTKAAACFNGAHYTTGGSHFSELKYLHIETNHEVPGWLIRVLELCERSFKRGRGPPARAPDTPLKDRNWLCDYFSTDLEDLANPEGSLISNFRWLPRVLESSNAMLAHAVGSELVKDKIAALFLPASKNDAGGTGVERPLRCTCSVPIADQQTCPAHTVTVAKVATCTASPPAYLALSS